MRRISFLVVTLVATLFVLSFFLLSREGAASPVANAKITGQISDELGSPLPGANVIITGTSFWAITDINGTFLIQDVPSGEYELRLNVPDYKTIIIRNVPVKKNNVLSYHESGLKIEIKTEVSSIAPQAMLRGLALRDNYIKIPIYYATDRKRTGLPDVSRFYGHDRGVFQVGICEVSIPRDHKMGELESPEFWRLEFRQDPGKHVVLLHINQLERSEFWKKIKLHVQKSTKKEILVFVHGFNVTFEDGARRTAQLAYDLGFDGAPILYSWPSQGKLSLLGYTTDENNVAWTVPHLKEFLKKISLTSGVSTMHLIAHSMGNRALTAALKSIVTDQKEKVTPRFNELVLMAPDIDSEIFRRDIAPAIIKSAERITLYASSNDKALLLSKKFHTYPRAGQSGDDIILIPNMDTIDVSDLDTDLVGHSYYGDDRSVISDLFVLLKHRLGPDERNLLHVKKGGQIFWKFKH